MFGKVRQRSSCLKCPKDLCPGQAAHTFYHVLSSDLFNSAAHTNISLPFIHSINVMGSCGRPAAKAPGEDTVPDLQWPSQRHTSPVCSKILSPQEYTYPCNVIFVENGSA